MEQFDLAIAGGGIIGITIAYLARSARPDLSVLLIDRAMTGRGATYFSGGHMHPHGSSIAQRDLAARSMELYGELAAKVTGLGFRSTQLFAVVSHVRAQEVLGGYIAQAAHIATEEEEEVLRRTFVDLRLGHDQVLLAGVTSQYGSPPQVVQAILRHLRTQLGFHCWESARLDSFFGEKDKLRLQLSGVSIAATQGVCCTGPWMRELLGADVVQRHGLRVKKVAALHLERIPDKSDPILYFFDEDAYLLPLHEQGYWILSFTSEEWDCDPNDPLLTISLADRRVAEAVLQRYVPSWLERRGGGRVSCDLYSRNRLPLAMRSPDCSRVVFAGAGSGFGYRLAPVIAEWALSLLEGYVPQSKRCIPSTELKS